mmetsp:Transcript_43768/g.123682  ORF Transcript_43768/g.123682 Transcript_43768/m.123682 type:complete len:121 (-) Transcript_43768:310-672(-)
MAKRLQKSHPTPLHKSVGNVVGEDHPLDTLWVQLGPRAPGLWYSSHHKTTVMDASTTTEGVGDTPPQHEEEEVEAFAVVFVEEEVVEVVVDLVRWNLTEMEQMPLMTTVAVVPNVALTST